MKELTMFYFPECPYCRQALGWHEEIFARHPEYKEVPLRLVDEHVETALADSYDYWYVPTYFIGTEKLCEGVKKKELIEAAFRRAYEGSDAQDAPAKKTGIRQSIAILFSRLYNKGK